MQTSIPPLRLIPLELKQFPCPINLGVSSPEYWFGDRLLTTKGWGICTGVKRCKSLNGWLYYIDLDDVEHPQPFFTSEIIQKHNSKI